jgi:tripartite-type tricarboxylate transporter receptor subunit TctC
VTQQLHNIIRQALLTPEFVKSAAAGGFDVPDMSISEVDTFLRADAARWRDVARTAHIVLE